MQNKYEELPPNQCFEFFLNRKKLLEKIISEKTAAISKAPEGRLRISKCKGTPQYYYMTKRGEKSCKYINKKNLNFAKQLAQITYDESILKELKAELKNLNAAIKLANRQQKLHQRMNKFRARLITPVTLSKENYQMAWINQHKNYIPKAFEPESPVLLTSKGERVRSKSEVIIADTLNRLGIPYIYELPVKFKNFQAHPDFCCLNLRTRQEFLWEHFGMLEDSEYAAKSVKKIHQYQQSGYFPGKNLIISTEIHHLPFSSRQAEEIAREYLL